MFKVVVPAAAGATQVSGSLVEPNSTTDITYCPTQVFEAGSMTYVILDMTYVILPAGRRLPAPPASSAPAFHIF